MATPAPAKERLLKESVNSDFINEPKHTCSHCGCVGREMVSDSRGYYYCIDRVACWERWDGQHGLKGFNLE